MTRAERLSARLTQGASAVVTPAHAAELLPFSDAAARAWLRRHKLVREDPDLGDYVIWGEVLGVLRGEADRQAASGPPRKTPPSKLPRKKLGRSSGEKEE